jgi:hypothetical protein
LEYNEASDPINIQKGVKQGCLLSPLLLDICVNSLISLLRGEKDLGYETSEITSSVIQAYADDMILVSNSEENLQKLINRAKSFFDFANIKLNPRKCEVMVVNPTDEENNNIINGVMKQYMAKNSFIKYLEIPLGSIKLSKTKFLEVKVQKVLEELDKVEFSGFALHQVMKVMRRLILNMLYFVFANMDVPKNILELIDRKVR